MNETYQPRQPAKEIKRGPFCQNVSGEEMPAYSACVVTGQSGDTYTVSKPAEDSAKEILFSPAHAVPDNGYFYAVNPFDELVTYNGSVSPGDTVGAVNGQWYVETGKTGLVVLSGSGVSLGCALLAVAVSRKYQLAAHCGAVGQRSPTSP